MDLTVGGNDDYTVHVYSVDALAQINKLDLTLAFSEITFYWFLHKIRHFAMQANDSYQSILDSVIAHVYNQTDLQEALLLKRSFCKLKKYIYI